MSPQTINYLAQRLLDVEPETALGLLESVRINPNDDDAAEKLQQHRYALDEIRALVNQQSSPVEEVVNDEAPVNA